MITDNKSASLFATNCSLLSSPLVNDCHFASHPIQKALFVAWIELSELGITEFREKGKQFVVDLLTKQLAEIPQNDIQPSFWYLTSKLPRDEQNKISDSEFERICTQPLVDALWLSRIIEPDSCIWIGKVPLDLSFFAGHFVEFPLVPGVVELQWCVDKIKEFLARDISIERVDNLKFQKFLRPNDEFELTLKYQYEKARINFQFRTDNEICAGGMIIIGND